MKWEYFLRPNNCGLHQSYLIVINISLKFLSTQFDHSWIGLLMQTKKKKERKNERKALSLLFEALKLVSQKLYFTL